MSTQVTPLTRKAFKDMSVEDLRKIVDDPTKLAEANSILDGSIVPEVAPEVIPPDAEKIEADRLAAESVAAEAAETARKDAEKAAEAVKAAELNEAYKNAGISVETDSSGNIVKIVMNYQALDEAKNPIGRPTYLEAKSWFELTTKQRAAHENAVRFAERIKKQKLTVKKEDPNEPKPLTEEELIQLQEDLKGEDRSKATKAADQIRDADARKAVNDALAAKVSFEFLTAHIEDYNRCEANNKLLSDYIRGNNLEWTRDNLELALTALESQLAPKEPPVQKEQPVPAVPINPAPAAPVVVTPPPVTATQPAPPAATIQQPLAPRPGVNSGIIPGQNSGSRPTNQPKGLTKADVKNMPPAEFRRRLKDPKFVAEVNALQIKGGL